MRRAKLVLLFSAVLCAPLAGGLVSYAANPGAGGSGGPGLDNFRDPYPPKSRAQKEQEREEREARQQQQSGAAGVDGGAPDAAVDPTTGGPRHW
jgi:hypothetical protein